MAIHHAGRAELVDLNEWPAELEESKSHVIIKTDFMEVARLVLDKGKTLARHSLPKPIVIHCLSGSIELETDRARQAISQGQLLYLEADDPHSLTGLKNAVVLLTIIGG